MATESNREEPTYLPPEPELYIKDIEVLKVLFSERRLEIIQHLIDEPRSVQAVARILQKPVHRLYYHFNRLIENGLIRLVKTQSLPGAVEEKFYQIAANRLVIDRGLLYFHKESDGEKHIRNVLEETQRLISYDLDNGRVIAINDQTNLDVTAFIERRTTHVPKDRLPEFQDRLIALLDEFTNGDYSDHQDYALTLVLHPTDGRKRA